MNENTTRTHAVDISALDRDTESSPGLDKEDIAILYSEFKKIDQQITEMEYKIKANVKTLEEEYPGAMPYFFSQDPDYITVKERVANLCANGEEATGVATIDIAVNTLKVAEYLTPTMKEQLLG